MPTFLSHALLYAYAFVQPSKARFLFDQVAHPLTNSSMINSDLGVGSELQSGRSSTSSALSLQLGEKETDT